MKRLLATMLLGAAISGCATVNPMAFDGRAAQIDTTGKSVVLMTIEVSRPDDSRHVPNPFVVKFEKHGAQSKQDRQNFKLDRSRDAVSVDGHQLFLARMALEPGRYRLGDITGNANAFPFNSLFVVPLLLDLDVRPNAVTYVGRVTARLRPRQEGEFRAGPLIPLVDQAVAGMSTGTWDVSVDDRSREDVPLFVQNYPALARASIDSALLPPFDRAAVQRWWDGQAGEPSPPQRQAVSTAAAPTAPPEPVVSAPALAEATPPAATVAASPVATPAPAGTPDVRPTGRQVLPADAAFRDSPRLGAPSRVLPAGTEVDVRSQLANAEGQWWFVAAAGDIGWIRVPDPAN